MGFFYQPQLVNPGFQPSTVNRSTIILEDTARSLVSLGRQGPSSRSFARLGSQTRISEIAIRKRWFFQWVFLSRHKHGLFENYSSSRWCWSWKRAIRVERCGWDIAMPGKWCHSQHLRQAASWGGPLARLTKTLIQQISIPKKGTQFSIHGFVCFKIWKTSVVCRNWKPSIKSYVFFIKHVGESQSPDDIAGLHWWGLARLLSCGLCTVAGARKLAQCRVGLGT